MPIYCKSYACAQAVLPECERKSSNVCDWRKQESLANAKVSARQQSVRVYMKAPMTNQREEHNVEKYIQWVTLLSLSSFV